MMSSNFIDHAYLYFNERRITITDEEGYDETVQFEWSEDGAEGFATVCNLLQDKLPSESRTYVFE